MFFYIEEAVPKDVEKIAQALFFLIAYSWNGQLG